MARSLALAVAVSIGATCGPAAAAAKPRQVSGCRFVTAAHARDLLGPTASRVPGTGRSCLYTTGGPTATDRAKSLLVQAWETPDARLPRVSPLVTAVRVNGMKARLVTPDPTSIGTLVSYYDGHQFNIAAAGTSDDLETAKAAMTIAFDR